ncbi:hypothetical protein C3492_36865 [Streptomyces sp. Ru62]|uniref:hypothetical protein n=1 Tax=Streptomyces sp. Ru62 TaxID=2080745 RepID=UPI000D41677D|nr:hypothetical protein [Streptomyces sp. Ru62]POX58620.1 hypothetical protein C3492_36865 [Streptomyces sp. Ru62]
MVDHETGRPADEILCRGDLALVYGGQGMIEKYHSDFGVLPQGPGRSTILITAGVYWHTYLDTVVSSPDHQRTIRDRKVDK